MPHSLSILIKDKARLEHRIERAKELIKKHYADETKLSTHGMRALGYQIGRIDILEEWLDDVNEQIEQ